MSDSPAVVTLSINDGDRIDGIADASSLLAVGTAYKASVADQRLEQGEKLLSSIVGNVTSTQGWYTANADSINAAASAIGNLMASDVTKKATAEILHVANKVLGALDALSAVHPFIGLAVVAFKGIVQFEMKRRENDKRVSALMLQATDMFSELLSLNHLNDPDQVLPGGQTIRGRLQVTLDKVLASIKDMGNCFNKYHQSKPISRFFKAMQWEDKFIGLADTFTGLKKDVKTALIIRAAIRIEDAATGVERLDVKLEILMDMIRTKPTAEQKVADAVASRGGKEAVLNDTSKIQEVIKATTVVDKKHDSSNARVDASLLYEIRTPLETQLAENRRLFEVTLEIRTNELKQAVHRTQERILYALNKGAFTRIKDPHIRYIWRSMKWTLSVQTAKFVPALCDYFSEQVGISKHHDTHQSTVSSPPSPSLTAQSRTGGDEEEEGPPAVSSDDEWCLVCLHLPTLKEALDDDFNGLVNVSEVNNFARSKSMPADWSILKRLAYASEGWNIERYTYALKIQALVNSMTYESGLALPANRALVVAYLNSAPLLWVKQVARGVKEMVSAGSSEIYELIDERTSRHESYLESILDKIKYEIPSTDALFVYFESDHLEHYIMPLLFLILRHHARIARLARNIVLDRRELEQASSTLHVVIDCAIARARKLAEIFQQLGLDEAAKFAAYAGGMYRILWASSPMPNEYEYWRKYSGDAEDLGIDLDTLSDASALRYGAPDPMKLAFGEQWQDESTTHSADLGSMEPLARFQHVAQHVLARVQQGRRWDHLKARRNAMEEYSKLAIPAALGELRWQLDGPKSMTPEQEKTLSRLLLVLSPRDLAYLRAKGDLELRQAFPVHVTISCDGCHISPLTYERHDCLDCKNGKRHQLCRRCVHIPTDKHMFPNNNHSIEHNMTLFKFEIPRNRALRFRGDREFGLKPGVPAPRYSDGDPETCNKAKLLAEICMECKKEMYGEFYACSTCIDQRLPPLILCRDCTFKPELAMVEPGHSQQNHFLILIRNRNTSYLYGVAPKGKEETPDKAKEPTMNDLVEQVKSLQSRLDIMDKRMHRLDTLDQRMGRLDTLDQRMSRLDNMEQSMNVLIQLVQQLAHSSPIAASSE